METFKEEKHADTAEDALQAQETESSKENTLPAVEVQPTEGPSRHCKSEPYRQASLLFKTFMLITFVIIFFQMILQRSCSHRC